MRWNFWKKYKWVEFSINTNKSNLFKDVINVKNSISFRYCPINKELEYKWDLGVVNMKWESEELILMVFNQYIEVIDKIKDIDEKYSEQNLYEIREKNLNDLLDS
tara:strand:+ start:2604 stop:2918 length:315 start_codon:yes stop_codon:yes gene_type:complete